MRLECGSHSHTQTHDATRLRFGSGKQSLARRTEEGVTAATRSGERCMGISILLSKPSFVTRADIFHLCQEKFSKMKTFVLNPRNQIWSVFGSAACRDPLENEPGLRTQRLSPLEEKYARSCCLFQFRVSVPQAVLALELV